MTDYDTVFWDIGGVLLDVSSVRDAHRAFIDRLLDEYDLDVESGTALATWRETVGEHFGSRDGTEFRSARSGYHQAVEAVAGAPVPEDEWYPLFREVSREHLRENDGAAAVTETLADAGVYQGIVSDVDAEEGAFILDHLGVREHVDDVTTSEAVGRTKPDPAMFETALSKSPHPPDRTVMVGDRYEHDVAGAAEHGIDPVAFGADDGPAVVHRIETLHEMLAVVGVDER